MNQWEFDLEIERNPDSALVDILSSQAFLWILPRT